MHISEGVLSLPVITIGYALTAAGVGIGLKQLKDEDIVKTAVFSAAFFIASLIHVPLGPSNVHLILNGLVGLLLGPVSFCAIFLALLLQAILFQFGGLTSLGVNTFNMAMPALLCYVIFFKLIKGNNLPLVIIGFLTGFISVLISALLLSISLILSGEHFTVSAKLIFIAHIPVMVTDGIITAIVLQFIKKVKPEILCV
ncbi:MAG: cobalt transporter CbiM [Candidatus Omnitrophica bacterium]|nr:cobalt transporter CbiM [Candidatus Omnitrophota bacterium]